MEDVAGNARKQPGDALRTGALSARIPRILGMTPGAIWLNLRHRFNHGLSVAWYRDVVRPRILRTAPVTNTVDRTCEIHVLTSSSDWLNLIWTLKSFYAASGRRYALCIHEDGTLGDDAIAVLRSHFPAARVILRQEADALAEKNLRHYPRCLAFRRVNVLAPKLFDFVSYLESDRMALFDSDLLFFGEPTEFLRRIEDPKYQLNAFNEDCTYGYAIPEAELRLHLSHSLPSRINSGLGLVHRESLHLDWIEDFLAIPDLMTGHFWRIEQTLFALCSARFGVDLLPGEYAVHLDRSPATGCFRHYVGAIRHLMYSEGIAALRGRILD
jgi:hypothetical protein